MFSLEVLNLLCRYINIEDYITLRKVNKEWHREIIVPSRFQTLPQELLTPIIDALSREDLLALINVSKSYCNNFIPILSIKCHLCHQQIERKWNRLAEPLNSLAKQR